MPRTLLAERTSCSYRLAIVTTCLALILLSLPLSSQSQSPRVREDARGNSTRDRDDADRRERSEREGIRRRQEELREADEDRARARSEPDSESWRYFREREAAERERALQWQREREAAARDRALWEQQQEREAEARRRALRDLQEREAAARERALQERERSSSRPPLESYRESIVPPGRYETPRSRGSASGMSCSALPYCPMASGYGNVCKGVKESATRGAAKLEIIRLCQRANSPEPCGADLPGGSQAKNSYLVTFGGGCARQCVSVAECSASTSR